ncbi:MAG: hypothetical protein KME16_17205 [Scytolyngbya sp. HA4215-MV1]|jgi:hypothetical protein|nr:hypothetical protein [Scytolyngbya sp. HA4215-MV1]
MGQLKMLGWTIATVILVEGLMIVPARADRSYGDITGTNTWNNNAPGYHDNFKLDPALVERVSQINREADVAYRDCETAIAQIEQAPEPPRRFARQPPQPPAIPAACVRLEELRSEAETLRATLDQLAKSRPNPNLRTW